jgi:rhamnosyltransferase
MIFAAGIVTYYPELSRLSESIDKLNKQVDLIYIVDNTPNPDDALVKFLYDLNPAKIRYKSNNLNIGLAKALNQLCEIAIKDGNLWLLLLDQDSLVSDYFFSNLIKYIHLPNVGLFSPTVMEDNLGIIHKMTSCNNLLKNDFVEVNFAITSGSFINLNFFQVVGGFYEDLFVDGIDSDYSRLLSHFGYKIYWLSSNSILHEYGSSEETLYSKLYFKMKNKNHPFFIRRNYPPIRIYYQFRNTVILYRRWKNVDKQFIKTLLRFFIDLFIQSVRIMIIEKNRFKNLIFITKGIINGMFFNVKKVES